MGGELRIETRLDISFPSRDVTARGRLNGAKAGVVR